MSKYILLIILWFQLPVLAASRAVIMPGTGQALILVEEIDYTTGQIDEDPYRLSEALKVPWQSPGNGDRGKILEDEFMKLVCVERAATQRRQCQFILRTSDHTHIDPISKQVQYEVNDPVILQHWASGLNLPLEAANFEFKTSDGRVQWQLKPDKMVFLFQEMRL